MYSLIKCKNEKIVIFTKNCPLAIMQIWQFLVQEVAKEVRRNKEVTSNQDLVCLFVKLFVKTLQFTIVWVGSLGSADANNR